MCIICSTPTCFHAARRISANVVEEVEGELSRWRVRQANMSRALVNKRRSNQDEDEQPTTRRHGGVRHTKRHTQKQMRI